MPKTKTSSSIVYAEGRKSKGDIMKTVAVIGRKISKDGTTQEETKALYGKMPLERKKEGKK